MTRLTDLQDPYRQTKDATAVAADIATGKTAYGPDGQLVGTNLSLAQSGGVNGIHLLIENPMNAAQAGYEPTEAGVLVKNTDLILTSDAAWDLDADGIASQNASSKLFAKIENLPVNAGIRKWEMWGQSIDATPAQYAGFNIRFNDIDGLNFYENGLTWDGTYWRILVTKQTAGTPAYSLITNHSSAVDWPIKFHFIIYDLGDQVVFQSAIYEMDNPGNDDAKTSMLSVTNRDYKAATEGQFLSAGNAAQAMLKGCKVSDL